MKNFKINQRIFVIPFFVFYFAIGIAIYKDYGIPWDESIQRKYGKDVYNYVLEGDERLHKNNKDKYYGPAFEFFLYSVEKKTNTLDSQKIYFQRHFFIFILSFLGVIFYYKLLFERFNNWKLALLGCSFLIISPRIFAHSFYNSKDLPTMSVFIIGIYFSYLFLKTKSIRYAAMAALTNAVGADIKNVGVIVPVMTISLYSLDLALIYLKNKGVSKKDVKPIALYVLLTVGLIILFWPTLWPSPFKTFIAAAGWMATCPQTTSILYFGQRVKSIRVPWHYALGWIFVTTPIIYLTLFLIGLPLSVADIVKRPINSIKKRKLDLLLLGWFFIPLVSVVVVSSSCLYDGWRQLFFIYPALLYFSIVGLRFLLTNLKSKIIKILIFVIVGLNLSIVISFMTAAHPFQNLYFNELAISDFEQDYWGLSYRKALEYVVENDKRENIKIRVENLPGETNVFLLDKTDRERVEVGDNVPNADYFITNYRGVKRDYDKPLIFAIFVNGEKIIGVHKLN